MDWWLNQSNHQFLVQPIWSSIQRWLKIIQINNKIKKITKSIQSVKLSFFIWFSIFYWFWTIYSKTGSTSIFKLMYWSIFYSIGSTHWFNSIKKKKNYKIINKYGFFYPGNDLFRHAKKYLLLDNRKHNEMFNPITKHNNWQP